MTESEILMEYLKGTDITVKELIERNAFAPICQAIRAYHLNEQRKLASDRFSADVVKQSEQLCQSPSHYAMEIGLQDECSECGAKS